MYEIQLSIEELCDLINIFFAEQPYEELLKLEERWFTKNAQNEITESAWFSQLVKDMDLENGILVEEKLT